MVDLFDETCNSDPAATLVSYPQVESGMQRAKRMQNPKIPASTLEFEELLQRHQDLGLYYRGSVWSGDRSAVIFASEEASAKLSAGQIVEIQFDGTFITAPEPYKQTWTITGVYNGKVFPFVTVLMTGRTKSLYKAVLTELKVLYPNFNPSHAMGEHEVGARNAIREIFPQIAISSCQFHHAQSCYRAVCRIGLKVKYDNDPVVKNHIRAFMALTLLPPRSIEPAFQTLRTMFFDFDVDVRAKLLEFARYYQKTWLETVSC
jgi:hypothetical protein